MNWTEFFLEVLKISLPAIIVGGTVLLLIKRYFESESAKRAFEIRSRNNQHSLPLRLQAYERLAIFLERISANSLIMRVKRPGMSAQELAVNLLSEIRGEFEHNLSQQIYVTHEIWTMVVNAKEEMNKMINLAYSNISPDSSGLDLSKSIIELSMMEEINAQNKALLYLKREASELL